MKELDTVWVVKFGHNPACIDGWRMQDFANEEEAIEFFELFKSSKTFKAELSSYPDYWGGSKERQVLGSIGYESPEIEE